jgi:hypothetical protein
MLLGRPEYGIEVMHTGAFDFLPRMLSETRITDQYQSVEAVFIYISAYSQISRNNHVQAGSRFLPLTGLD